MNVAMYHPWVYLKSGAERTLLELMKRSRHNWTLYTNHYEPDATFPELREFNVVDLGGVSVKRTIWDVGRACVRVTLQDLPLRDSAALMISSEGLGNLVVLRPRPLPVFCFCHTPLRVVYDPYTRQRYFMHQQPGKVMRSALGLYTRVDRLAWNRYDRVFCNSHEVAGRVLNAGLAPPEKVEVAYPGVDLARFTTGGPSEPYFLLAGRIARTKTVELGIDAFLRLKAMVPEAFGFRLVIAGMVDEKSRSHFQELLERAAGHPDIDFVVDPDDATLLNLYRHCYATLFCALNEDWGLVVLEAMACGKPVIAVNRGGPTESVIDGQTGLLRPAEPEPFASAMEHLVKHPGIATSMGQAGHRRVERFTWGTFANRIDAYIDGLVVPARSVERVTPADTSLNVNL